MARKPSAQIPLEALNIVFDDFDLWPKIRDGRLHSTILVRRDALSHHYPGALSRIVKHSFPDGRHVATTHRIEDPQGNTLHEDAKQFISTNRSLPRPRRLWRK